MNDLYYRHNIKIDSVSYAICIYNKDVDYISKNIFLKSIPYEIDMLRHIVKNIDVDSTFIDIGANIGNHSLYVAAQTGCNVIAFEPNKNLTEAFKKSIEYNNFENIVVYEVGLASCTSKAQYKNINPENTGSQSVLLGVGDINIEPLDSFTNDIKVGAIKIDVEGLELEVLHGAKKTIENNCPLIYIECSDAILFGFIFDFMISKSYCYVSTFNVTPTHFFVHNKKILKYKQEIKSTLATLIYDKEEINKKNKIKINQCNKNIESISSANQELAKINKENLSHINILLAENSLLNKKNSEQEVRICELINKCQNL